MATAKARESQLDYYARRARNVMRLKCTSTSLSYAYGSEALKHEALQFWGSY